MERTLVVLKADTLQRGIVGEIISRFEKVGMKVVGMKMMVPNEELANKHYPVDRIEFIDGIGNKALENYKEMGKDPIEEIGTDDPHEIGLRVQRALVEYLASAPVVAVVLEGPHAVELTRKIVGHTLPSKAQPGTIRGDFSFDSSTLANASRRPLRNLVHASGSEEEAEFEIDLWFNTEELLRYDAIHQRHMVA